MNTKEKAKELVDKYKFMAEIKHIDIPTEENGITKVKNAKIELASKKCALIAVENTLTTLRNAISEIEKNTGPITFGRKVALTKLIDEQLEVKQEIEKL